MKKMFRFQVIAVIAAAGLITGVLTGCGTGKNEETKKMEEKLKTVIKDFESKMKPLTRDAYRAYFEASVASNDENWNKFSALDMKMNEVLSNKEDFKKIKEIKESKLVNDPILKRQMDLIYLTYLSKAIDTNKLNELSKMQTDIEKKYSKFRAKVGNKEYTDNDVEEVLKNSTELDLLKNVWTGQKEIGNVVAGDIIKLVKKRNEVAKELGFKNFHDMSLRLSEEDPDEISKLFDDLDNLTRDAFKKEKEHMDQVLSARLKIKPEELMPWHYQNRFFQEAPKVYDIDLDQYFKNKDLVGVTEKYYKSLNLPIEDMVAKSDLFEKPNKNQHAYCINIDRDEPDIRVLCNVKDNNEWAGTLLHEYGHALYEKFYDKNLPWTLKQPAHIFTTEAIAMMFGRLPNNAQWMKEMIGLSDADKAKVQEVGSKMLRLQQLCFSRWSQVMYRFEKSLYENPDQDLNKLWWDLVEKYQMIKRPAGRNNPDWASKIHIATSPCYYHNYHMGELFASQLFYTLADKVLKTNDYANVTFYNHPEVGDFLKKNVFGPGAKYEWNDMIERATGSKLTAKYYAKQFVN